MVTLLHRVQIFANIFIKKKIHLNVVIYACTNTKTSTIINDYQDNHTLVLELVYIRYIIDYVETSAVIL